MMSTKAIYTCRTCGENITVEKAPEVSEFPATLIQCVDDQCSGTPWLEYNAVSEDTHARFLLTRPKHISTDFINRLYVKELGYDEETIRRKNETATYIKMLVTDYVSRGGLVLILNDTITSGKS